MRLLLLFTHPNHTAAARTSYPAYVEVSSMNHAILDHAMKWRSLEPEALLAWSMRNSKMHILSNQANKKEKRFQRMKVTCAKSTKVFSRLRDIITEQPYHNPPHILPHRIANAYVKVYFSGDLSLQLDFQKSHPRKQNNYISLQSVGARNK